MSENFAKYYNTVLAIAIVHLSITSKVGFQTMLFIISTLVQVN